MLERFGLFPEEVRNLGRRTDNAKVTIKRFSNKGEHYEKDLAVFDSQRSFS
jgi:hypothetical protein